MRLGYIIVGCCLTASVFVGCNVNSVSKFPEAENAGDASQEESATMREYATVEEVDEDYVMVKTTKGELYRIGHEHVSNPELGALLLVVYEENDKSKNGDFFELVPTRVEKSSTQIEISF